MKFPLSLGLENIRGTRVYVIGDAIADHYHFGHVDRLSPEAPVPVFIEDRLEKRQGGALNVVENLGALGCIAYSNTGDNVCVKHRYMVGHQMLLRVDDDRPSRPSANEIDWAVGTIEATVHPMKAVVLSDYAKGWLTDTLCRRVILAAIARGIPVVVDPKGPSRSWQRYTGATVICPNEREWDVQAWPDFEVKAIVHKRGPRGLTLWEYDSTEPPLEIAARAKHVFDVTGAGDTVVAVLAAALGAGIPLRMAALLANLAAGHVVGEVGTAVCPAEVLNALVQTEFAEGRLSLTAGYG